MKTRVRVTLVATTQIELDVEHDENEDPTVLTKKDAQKARSLADVDWRWDVQDVEVAR